MAKFNNKTSKLTDVELVKENGSYYLSLEYLLEDDDRVVKLTVPRVRLPIDDEFYPEPVKTDFSLRVGDDKPRLELKHKYGSTISFPIETALFDDRRCFYILETIKEKEHEMTIEEIEKKLGYKVKIVSGDKKKR